MTAPRQILPGTVYFVTRRCAQRQFLLRPSKTTTDVFLYVLAVAAQRYGIEVHGFSVMSNHVHLVVSDPDAQLPEFCRLLFAMMARALNASLGRWESFWAPGSYSAVRLVSTEDIVDKIAYVLANPVKAGLVRTGRLWPGAWSDPDHFGAAPRIIARPRQFFADDGDMPPEASLELTIPAAFASADEFRSQVESALREHEWDAHREIRGDFVGAARVLAQDPFGRPESVEPRRNLSPRVAARDPRKRIEALACLAEFVRAYRRAWAERRAGVAGVVFPAGTYLLRIAHGVACASCG